MTIRFSEAEGLKNICDFYDRKSQLEKAAEELEELAEVLRLIASGQCGDDISDRYVDERADADIMLYQVDNWLMPGFEQRVADHRPKKIARQLGRIARAISADS
jgi:hypothetical protein